MTEPVHKLGDVLRTAREAKGVDLARVERDTKIRERYLSALERGDYRELPGAVYTRGFLRNYGAYLGLDAEELIDLYRLETSSAAAERASVPAPPKPLRTKRARAFVLTPSLIVAALLTVLVGGFFAYLGYQLVTYARTPDLRIIDPPGNVSGYTEAEITIRGETEPNAVVTVDGLTENPTVTADADGRFSVTVGLVPGSNVITLVADDPKTDRQSEPEERTIVRLDDGASPSAGPTVVELTSPEPGALVRGAVEVAGLAPPNAELTVSAELERQPTPTFQIVDAAGTAVTPTYAPPTPPEPATVTADAAGSFATNLRLPPGAWRITVASSATGGEASASVAVTPGPGLTAAVTIDGGESYLDLYEDGERVPEVSGRNAQDGDTVELSADRELRIRVGNAAVVRLRVNGIELGAMGGSGAVVEWIITRAGG
ncbi:MAG TPA: RodZ domain-containing protein [Candidatus Limnocylindria bacterium]|nr:RodZ domain-containing protein [Candidatus Limnocylindria bacterium]